MVYDGYYGYLHVKDCEKWISKAQNNFFTKLTLKLKYKITSQRYIELMQKHVKLYKEQVDLEVEQSKLQWDELGSWHKTHKLKSIRKHDKRLSEIRQKLIKVMIPLEDITVELRKHNRLSTSTIL